MKFIIAIALSCVVISDATAQWKFWSNWQVYGLGACDTTLFVSTRDLNGNRVARFTPNAPWVYSDTGIDFSQGTVTSFASLGPYCFANQTFSVDKNAGAYRSTDSGKHWQTPTIGAPAVVIDGIVFGMLGTSVAISTDSGKVATRTPLTLPNVRVFAGFDSCVLAINSSAGWRSLDKGSSWTQMQLPITGIHTTVTVGSIFFAANGKVNFPGPLIKSTDFGSSWTTITIPRRAVTALAAKDYLLFAGTDSGVYLSRDTGVNWSPVNDGLDRFLNVITMCVLDTQLFVHSKDNGTYFYTANRPFADFDKPLAVLEKTSVNDNVVLYPNPSTGKITIECSTPIRSVRLLNLIGEEVYHDDKQPSQHVTLDCVFAAGIYWCQIKTDLFERVEKVVILK